MAGKVVTMQERPTDSSVWTINKRLSEGDEFAAMRHRVRVVSVLEWKGEYALARVEDLGILPGQTEEPPPLRFDGRFGR